MAGVRWYQLSMALRATVMKALQKRPVFSRHSVESMALGRDITEI
jgi:hypothetical protein